MFRSYTASSVEAVLRFVPQFERGAFQKAREEYLESGVNPRKVARLISTIHGSGIMVPDFEWTKLRFQDYADRVDEIDVVDVRKLLTALARNDRFSGGAFAGACSNGIIASLLHRLTVLHEAGRTGPFDEDRFPVISKVLGIFRNFSKSFER